MSPTPLLSSERSRTAESFPLVRALFGAHRSELIICFDTAEIFHSQSLKRSRNTKPLRMVYSRFAYASNGPDTIEFDYFTGVEKTITAYPSPEELWRRYRDGKQLKDDTAVEQLLTPINFTLRQGERYYQEIAINRAVEAIVTGKRRVLLTMATGTGKTTWTRC
jgi:type I site-specific restriction endonuclease